MLPRPVHFPQTRPQPQYQPQPSTTMSFPYNANLQQNQFHLPQQNIQMTQAQPNQIAMSQPQQFQQQQQFQPMFQPIEQIQSDIQFFQQPQQIQMTQTYGQQQKFQQQPQPQNTNLQNMNIDPALLLQFPTIKQEMDSNFSPTTNNSDFGFVNSDFIQIQNEDNLGLNVLSPLSTSPLEHDFEEDRLKGSSTPIDMKNKNKSAVSKLQQSSSTPQFYSVSMPVPGGHPSSFNSSYGSFGSVNGFDGIHMDDRQLDALVSEIGSGDPRIDLINERRRRRRESHNAVERRRRDNINEKIQELATLLPDLAHDTQNRPNKGVILRRSVDYIRYIQQYSMKLEQRQRELENAVQRLGVAQELGLSFVIGSALDVAPYYIPGQVNGTPPPIMSVVREEPSYQQLSNNQNVYQHNQHQQQQGQQQAQQQSLSHQQGQQMGNIIQ